MTQALRFRLRLADGPGRYNVEVAADSSMRSLKAAIEAKLGLPSAGNLELSLNKEVMLQDTEAPITSRGLCSGDLIWVHGIPAKGCQQSPARSETNDARQAPSANSSNLQSFSSDATSSNKVLSHQKLPLGHLGLLRGFICHCCVKYVPYIMQADPKAAYGTKHKPYVANSPDQLPVNCSDTSTRQQQMRAAVVAVLIDFGLQLCADQDIAAGGTLAFTLPQLAASSAKRDVTTALVSINAMASHAVVCGSVPLAGEPRTASIRWAALEHPRAATISVSAACNHQPAGSCGAHTAAQSAPLGSLISAPGEFVVSVKDSIATPLTADLCAAAGLPSPPSLLTLPGELLLQCLGFLQAQHLVRLACVCRSMRTIALCNDLWRPLFEGEFGQADMSESIGGPHCWQTLYTKRYTQRSARRLCRPILRRGIAPAPFVRPPPFPGMIGGDADRLPFMAGRASGRFGGGFGSGFYPGFRQH